MTRQSQTPLAHRALSAMPRQAREVARQVVAGDIDLNPPYQRGAVWTVDQQIALVKSWLLGIPVPAIYLNERGQPGWTEANGENVMEVGKPYLGCIDGKQRLTAAVAWFEGELAVPASWFEPEHVLAAVETEDGPYVTNAGLSVEMQRHIKGRAVLPVIEAHVDTVAAEAEIYLLVNGAGTAQTEADMANAASVAWSPVAPATPEHPEWAVRRGKEISVVGTYSQAEVDAFEEQEWMLNTDPGGARPVVVRRDHPAGKWVEVSS